MNPKTKARIKRALYEHKPFTFRSHHYLARMVMCIAHNRPWRFNFGAVARAHSHWGHQVVYDGKFRESTKLLGDLLMPTPLKDITADIIENAWTMLELLK